MQARPTDGSEVQPVWIVPSGQQARPTDGSEVQPVWIVLSGQQARPADGSEVQPVCKPDLQMVVKYNQCE